MICPAITLEDRQGISHISKSQRMNLPSPTKRITVRDIARRLKISHTSVSRSLRDDRQISVALRQKVQQAAKIMGYRPDPMILAACWTF